MIICGKQSEKPKKWVADLKATSHKSVTTHTFTQRAEIVATRATEDKVLSISSEEFSQGARCETEYDITLQIVGADHLLLEHMVYHPSNKQKELIGRLFFTDGNLSQMYDLASVYYQITLSAHSTAWIKQNVPEGSAVTTLLRFYENKAELEISLLNREPNLDQISLLGRVK